ncbi:tRNA (guanosine(46)-N7)-methyltransferase TrmB [Microbacteriaceae bacterium]|nr:tRNA (guanosine(46)-N7)-methyltransferase TrmB [Candidatus Saccharibacteria bacterium]
MTMKEQLDPDSFIITRKRKLYKFAKFHNAENCFEFDEWSRRAVDIVEIGAGDGLFSVELATRYPDLSFVAIDVKADRLQKGAQEATSRGLYNISFLRARADQIDEAIELQSVKQLWVTFPDPFPKKRSAGRRLTHPTFLNKYQRILAPGGSLYLKHDNPTFFNWSLEQLVLGSWTIRELSFDLHESEVSDDYRIKTSYEKRWLNEGLVMNFVRAELPSHS